MHRECTEWWDGTCLQFSCILITLLCKALLKHCVWSTSVRSAERMATVAALLSFWLHFSTLASVAYNKTRLWKHFGVLTCTDKFKHQQGDMTKKGTQKHSANVRVNSISKLIEGYCDTFCLYFIILFSGLLYKQLEFQGVSLGGGFRVILVSSWSCTVHHQQQQNHISTFLWHGHFRIEQAWFQDFGRRLNNN